MSDFSTKTAARVTALGLAAALAACMPGGVSDAQTLAAKVETRRAYDLATVDGKAPTRAIRFYIGENSRFAVCGHCLCVTGVMFAPYPALGIRPTSASPTFACEQETPEFKADAGLAQLFFDMKQAQVDGSAVTFTGSGDHVMVFRRGGEDLTPP
ncbi:hypothetical protein BMG03_14695 [Thioclava nitratireducens]|uniref:DUF306 domain-containing protein n=1 Tax=Thioclava nitratireducens TaxID=1915078 RepID=A0ABM6IJ82_9RHOB|nr:MULTISPECIES: hypothetical protein [Thioclava]AQS48901.1 hypothetical protein BMG03_14695 [Thioclava nitratireducens]OWY12303.1 hypothetical protein B6V72_14470 [Thioclava sp. F34-6]